MSKFFFARLYPFIAQSVLILWMALIQVQDLAHDIVKHYVVLGANS